MGIKHFRVVHNPAGSSLASHVRTTRAPLVYVFFCFGGCIAVNWDQVWPETNNNHTFYQSRPRGSRGPALQLASPLSRGEGGGSPHGGCGGRRPPEQRVADQVEAQQLTLRSHFGSTLRSSPVLPASMKLRPVPLAASTPSRRSPRGRSPRRRSPKATQPEPPPRRRSRRGRSPRRRSPKATQPEPPPSRRSPRRRRPTRVAEPPRPSRRSPTAEPQPSRRSPSAASQSRARGNSRGSRPSAAPRLEACIPVKATPSAAPGLEARIPVKAMPSCRQPHPVEARIPVKAMPSCPALPKPPAQPPTHQQIFDALVDKVKAWQRTSDRHTRFWRSYVIHLGSRTFDPSAHDTGTLSEFLRRARDPMMSQMMDAMMKGSGKGASQDLVEEEPSDEPPARKRRLGTPPRQPRTPGLVEESAADAASSGVAAEALPSTPDSDTPSWVTAAVEEAAAAVDDARRECPP